MNTNMTGFRCFIEIIICVLVLWMKVASALEGMKELREYMKVNNGTISLRD